MKGRSINTATITGIALGALTFTVFGASSARASAIDGTGSVGTCVSSSGQIKMKPALSYTDSGPGAWKLKGS